ncbi:SMC family ATPase [Candidatus Woesearchaeota archaeon]|nr:SMC family ATPase [Candidatus Woesearchaeota archaeon]
MIIKWLKLQNIRSYTNKEIEFPQGTTLLSGDIGSGKSSILLGIEFALFGLLKGEVSGSALLRKGASVGEVELCFEIEGKEVIIKRILKKKKDAIGQENSHIIIDGVKKEAAPIELKAKILELLGYPMDFLTKKNLVFRYTVYTPQEEMKRIIFESKDERLNTLRKVFGIDKYKRIRENVILVQKRLKDQCKEISGFISDLDNKKEYLHLLNNECDLLSNEIRPLDADKDKIELDIKAIISEKEVKRRIFEDFNSYKNNLVRIDTEIESIVNERERNSQLIKEYERQISSMMIEKVDEDRKDLLEKEINEEERRLSDVRVKVAEIMQKEKSLMESRSAILKFIEDNKNVLAKKESISFKIEELNKSLQDKESLKAEHEKKSQEISMMERNKAVLQDKIRNSQQLIEKISGIDNCPMCLQKVDHEHKKGINNKEEEAINSYTEGIKIINDKIKNMKINEIKDKLAALESKEKDLNPLLIELNKIKNIEQIISERKSELEKIDVEINKLNEDKNSTKDYDVGAMTEILSRKKNEFRNLSEALARSRIKQEKERSMQILIGKNNEYKARILRMNEDKNSLNKDAERFKGIEEMMDSVERRLKGYENRLKEIELSLREKQTKISEKKGEADRIKKEIDDKEAKRRVMAKKKQYIDWIDVSFINIISIIEKNILASLYNEFNALFQEWFDILIEDELITARLDDEFSPIVQQNGYDIEVENMSGGEKTALALAYRLALNKVINDITTEINTKDLLILDEPTDGFSEHQLDKIRDVLDRLAMKQLIIVSHESKIESFVDNIIKISKQDHVSSVG